MYKSLFTQSQKSDKEAKFEAPWNIFGIFLVIILLFFFLFLSRLVGTAGLETSARQIFNHVTEK